MKGIIPFVFVFVLVYATETKAEEHHYSYENMMSDLQKMENNFPDFIQIGSIGKTEWGNDLPFVKIGQGKESILLIGAHHGREWITTQFLMKLLKDYVSVYKEKGKIGTYSMELLNEVSLVIVPMLNPDGVMIQQGNVKAPSFFHKLNIWKMNYFSSDFKRWKANGEGVDLNRQYPADWERLKKWPAWPSYKQYRGKKPIQAKEVAALVSFTHRLKPLLAVSYHTSGQEVYWYYHTKKEHLERDYTLAEQISEVTGYELAWPAEDAVGGGFTDWFIMTYARPSFTIEMCELVEETNPSHACLQNEYERNQTVPLMLIQELL